jgi:SAM-dependent methyltransferase
MRDRILIGQRLGGRHLFLREMAGDLKGESVLDIACGFGWFEEHALERGCERVVGIERAPELVREVSLALPAAEILELDATSGLSHLGKFDAVCAFDFLEHLPRGTEGAFLAEVAGLLQPQGRLLLSVPYRSALSNILDPAYLFGHRHYDLPGMRSLLAAAGLEVRRAAFAGGAWEQLGMIWLYLWKWVLRREMAFADFVEGKRRAEYERWSPGPGRLRNFATMFIEAALADGPGG